MPKGIQSIVHKHSLTRAFIHLGEGRGDGRLIKKSKSLSHEEREIKFIIFTRDCFTL
jgi:hypothetical protein